MTYKDEHPAGAKALLDQGSWTYLDVRTPEEFAAGHPPGAYNIPVALRGPGGEMTLNPDFAAVAKRAFQRDSALVVGCAAGGRSVRACQMLDGQGFTRVVNMLGGFSGARDASGRVVEPGWCAAGFPVEDEAPRERTWAGLA